MNEIKCPKCGTVFQIDEDQYLTIVKQIKDKEFEKELDNSIKLNEANLKEKFNEEKNKLDLEINDLKSKLKLKDTENELAIKD